MQRWFAKHWPTLVAVFLTALYTHLQLVEWKKHGDDLTPVAASVTVTAALWIVLAIGIGTYFRRLKRTGAQLSEETIGHIEKVGRLQSLAGRAEWLADYLEEVWHTFNKSKLNMPPPLSKSSIPDKIEAWTDKQLWMFRDRYRCYLGSLKAVDPDTLGDLPEFPSEGTDYLTLHRQIRAHAAALRGRASCLRSKAMEGANKSSQDE